MDLNRKLTGPSSHFELSGHFDLSEFELINVNEWNEMNNEDKFMQTLPIKTGLFIHNIINFDRMA